MAATTTFIILMIYVVLSLGGSLAPVPTYYRHENPSRDRNREKGVPNPAMDRTLDQDTPTPKCPSGLEFCENVGSYPGDEIRRALKFNSTFSTFFKRRRPQLESVTVKDKFDPRTTGNVDANEERVCDVQEQIIRPKVATNRNGEKKFIVNEGSEYVQFVKIEKCRNTDSQCSKISGTLPKNYSSRCVQKYSSSLMVAFDENYVDPFTDDFFFPTACVCYVKSPFRDK